MRSVCMCEKKETMTAMSMGGVESIVIRTEAEAENSLNKLLEDTTVGLIMITENIHNLIKPTIMRTKLERKDTLIILIPEPDGLKDKDYIMNYIKNSIGIKL